MINPLDSKKQDLDSKKIEKSDFHKSFTPLCDYRFHCFGSQIGFIQVANPTHTHNNLFTPHWQPLPITYLNTPSTESIPKPRMLDSMIEIARHLSHTIPYVRVDLYYISEQNTPKISVGELTFTPNGGSARFSPEHWDREFGKLWNLAPLHANRKYTTQQH